MKKLLLFILLGFSVSAFAQFKGSGFPTENVKDGIISHQTNSSLFGFINPNNFSMKQSYSMSYSTFGGQGMALGVYTNSMMYKFNKNLNVQLDASFIHSPYNTLGSDFQKNINGFYISRAAVNYRPWKDVYISLQYRNVPASYYSGYYGGYSGYNNGFFGGDPFISGR